MLVGREREEKRKESSGSVWRKCNKYLDQAHIPLGSRGGFFWFSPRLGWGGWMVVS